MLPLAMLIFSRMEDTNNQNATTISFVLMERVGTQLEITALIDLAPKIYVDSIKTGGCNFGSCASENDYLAGKVSFQKRKINLMF